MVLKYTSKKNFILLEGFARVCTVFAYFTDNPRISNVSVTSLGDHKRIQVTNVCLNDGKLFAVFFNSVVDYSIIGDQSIENFP